MTTDCRGFELAPWQLRWHGLDLDALPRSESIFALANGHLGPQAAV